MLRWNRNCIMMMAIMLIIGIAALGRTAAIAAENTSGVIKFLKLALASANEALNYADAGDRQSTLATLKSVRQLMKEITGDTNGIELQKANKAIKSTTFATEGDNMSESVKQIKEAIKQLKEIEAKFAQ
ncbi:MAG: hypothetical protein AB2L14_12460 [Candidatus Xenobiia bacterium LiM19]